MIKTVIKTRESYKMTIKMKKLRSKRLNLFSPYTRKKIKEWNKKEFDGYFDFKFPYQGIKRPFLISPFIIHKKDNAWSGICFFHPIEIGTIEKDLKILITDKSFFSKLVNIKSQLEGN